MRRATSASAFACSSAAIARSPLVSSASSGRPSDHSHEPRGFVERVAGAVAERDARLLRAGRSGAATSSTSVMRQQALERAAVDVLQRVEAGDLDALVDLVDAGVERPELDHLRADLRDEAAVGRAAGGRELGARRRCRRGSTAASASLSVAGRRQERLAAERPGELVFDAVLVEDRMRRATSALPASTRWRSGS